MSDRSPLQRDRGEHLRPGRSRPRRGPVAACLLVALLAVPVARAAETGTPPEDQAREYAAPGPKTILQLQPFRQSESRPLGAPGGRPGSATLVNLNPRLNSWLLLLLDRGGGDAPLAFHLENPDPGRQRIRLADAPARGVVITTAGESRDCVLWTDDLRGPLAEARRSALPYAPLCGDRLYLRNPVSGARTRLESVTDFLRDHVWGGERIVGFVRQEFYRDAFLVQGVTAEDGECPPVPGGAPPQAAMGEAYARRSVVPEHLGIEVAAPRGPLTLGCWYPVRDLPGVWLSAMQPRAVDPLILGSHRQRVGNLDSVESAALDYLVAFDLDAFELEFELGTDHPRLGWSDRTLPAQRDESLPGPDGVGGPAPLVTTGMVAPALASRTVAAFTGGFKRDHSAFRYGELSLRNHGSHYGFIEHGVVFSKLLPGLATLYVLDDGQVGLTTWTEADNGLLGRIRLARQNGVPLLEADPESGSAVPGALVTRWGAGNWSGSAEGKLRTLRAGACLQESPAGRFLVYGYFSSATPSAMVRVFQAYGCSGAMLLDMNALEHTYLALYARQGSEVKVMHLITDMTEVDKSVGGRLIPRFLGFPDNRDFFYLVRRERTP